MSDTTNARTTGMMTTLIAERTDVEPHLRTEAERRELFPLLEALADRLCQTQGLILSALRDAGLTVVPLDPRAREVAAAPAAETVGPGVASTADRKDGGT